MKHSFYNCGRAELGEALSEQSRLYILQEDVTESYISTLLWMYGRIDGPYTTPNVKELIGVFVTHIRSRLKPRVYGYSSVLDKDLEVIYYALTNKRNYVDLGVLRREFFRESAFNVIGAIMAIAKDKAEMNELVRSREQISSLDQCLQKARLLTCKSKRISDDGSFVSAELLDVAEEMKEIADLKEQGTNG